MAEAQLNNAKMLIQQKQYDEAYQILKKLQHPTATKWMKQIEELQQKDEFDSYVVDMQETADTYQALRLMSKIYQGIGYIFLLFGVIFAAIQMIDSIFIGFVYLFAVFISGISLIASGELMRVFVELAENGRKQNRLLNRIANKL